MIVAVIIFFDLKANIERLYKYFTGYIIVTIMGFSDEDVESILDLLVKIAADLRIVCDVIMYKADIPVEEYPKAFPNFKIPAIIE